MIHRYVEFHYGHGSFQMRVWVNMFRHRKVAVDTGLRVGVRMIPLILSIFFTQRGERVWPGLRIRARVVCCTLGG